MVLHPEIQKRAQLEIDSVCGGERLPVVADRDNLPVLKRCHEGAHEVANLSRLWVSYYRADVEINFSLYAYLLQLCLIGRSRMMFTMVNNILKRQCVAQR